MTLSELQTALLEHAEESGTGFLTPEDARVLLNRALRDLARKTNFRVVSYTLAITDAQVYDLTVVASRFLSLYGVWDGSNWWNPSTLSEVRSFTPHWFSNLGSPKHFFCRGLWNMVVYPKLPTGDTRNVTVLVSEMHPELVNPTDAVVGLPESLHIRLVEGALALFYLDDKELSKYSLLSSKWQEVVSKTFVWANDRLSAVRTYVVGGGSCQNPL